MSAVSGNGGLISQDGTNAVSSIGNWRITQTGENPSAQTSSNGGMEVVIPGNVDWNFSYDFKGKEIPAVPGNSHASFFGYNGVDRASAAVVITQVTINCDSRSGAPHSGTVTGVGNGALARAAGAAPVNTANVPLLYSGNAGDIEWAPRTAASNTLQSYADIPDPTAWSLTLNCEAPDYVSGDTGGVVKRVVSNKSASGSFSFLYNTQEYLDTNATLLAPRTYGGLRLFVDTTTYYALVYVLLGEVQTTVDVETGVPVEHTIPFKYSGWAPIGAGLTWTRGSLVTPASTTFWS
jgi:hypothetical protein